MKYDEYYATQNEDSKGSGILWVFIHFISVAMESEVFSSDYSGNYYLGKETCAVKGTLHAGINVIEDSRKQYSVKGSNQNPVEGIARKSQK